MSNSRMEVFEQMLAGDPKNTTVLFGLAKEYEKVSRFADVVETLETYFANADDEGNAYGMLAQAYEKLGKRDDARKAYERGIEAAKKHGHAHTMAEDYRQTLETEYADD